MATIEMVVALMAKIPALQTVMGGSVSESVLEGGPASSACAVERFCCIFPCLSEKESELFLDAKKLKIWSFELCL